MNWGKKIVLGLALFMLFIIGMAAYMFKVQDNDPLIEENYYESGIKYDEQYDAEKQVYTDNAEPEIKISASQLIIRLKDSATYELKMLRPSSSKEDRVIKGKTLGDAHLIVIDKELMASGLWFFELRWTNAGKNYLYRKNLTL